MTIALQEIPLEQLHPSPHNPRSFPANDPALASLADSVRAKGVLEPILVRPRTLAMAQARLAHTSLNATSRDVDGFEILAGERRFRAAQIVKLETIPAIVREGLTAQEALEITVTENLQREDLHPLEEAKGVASLLGAGHDIAAVADRLGKSPAWVARRARLTNLSPAWRGLIESPDREPHYWSIACLEIMARLEPSAQDEYLRDHDLNREFNAEFDLYDLPEVDGVRREVAELTRELRLAGWKLDDELLYPEAGACSACPKRSSCHPLLFDDDDDVAKGKRAAASDRCLDSACWAEKAKRHTQREVDRLVAAGVEVVIEKGERTKTIAPDRKRVDEWRGEPAKKGEAGAVAVLTADGALKWKKFSAAEKRADASDAKRGGPGQPAIEKKPKSLAERRKDLDARRSAHAVLAFREDLVNGKLQQPGDGVVWRLVAAFGTAHRHDLHSYATASKHLLAIAGMKSEGYGSSNPWRLFERLASKDEQVFAALWVGVREVLASRLVFYNNGEAEKRWKEVQQLSELIGIDASAYSIAAGKAIPEPKSWAKLAEAEKATKKTKRKSAPSPPAEISTFIPVPVKDPETRGKLIAKGQCPDCGGPLPKGWLTCGKCT